MSLITESRPQVIPQLRFDKASLIYDGLHDLMYGVLPGVIYKDPVLSAMLEEHPVGEPEAFLRGETILNEKVLDRIAQNARTIADILSSVRNADQERFDLKVKPEQAHMLVMFKDGQLPDRIGENNNAFVDVGPHIELDEREAVEMGSPEFAINTLLHGQLIFSADSAIQSNGCNFSRPIRREGKLMTPGTLGVFVLRGTPTMPPSIHDFKTLSDAGRISNIQIIA
jgi:hypothetical protein